MDTGYFGARDGTFFSTIEQSTGLFSQICPARHCTANLEFVSSPVITLKKAKYPNGYFAFLRKSSITVHKDR